MTAENIEPETELVKSELELELVKYEPKLEFVKYEPESNDYDNTIKSEILEEDPLAGF